MQLSSHPKPKIDTVARVIPNRHRLNKSRIVTIAGFLLPGLVVYSIFVIWPILQASYYSLYRWNGLGPLQDFRGLDNYVQVFNDPVFTKALGHNFFLAILSIGIQLPLALGLALIVARKLPGRTFFRAVFFLPFVLADTATGVLWSFMYRPEGGLLNNLIGWLGIPPQTWLGNLDLVLISIFITISWKYFGFHLILYVAGLQQIPADLEEAARIDGATGFQVLRHITIPLLGSTIRLSVFLSILGSLQYFDLIWVMSKGGPVQSSETMATYLIKYGFERFSLGYGSTVALVMFLLCFVFSLAYQRMVMQRDIAGGVTSMS